MIVVVIVWLNGPFGIGKTSTAHALLQRMPGAVLYDPEPFGTALRHAVLHVEVANDFQNLRAWPSLLIATARVLRTAYPDAQVVMPLTVLDLDRARVLTAELRNVDPTLYRFRLVASEAVLRTRILMRHEEHSPQAWCLSHLEGGMRLMANPEFGEAVSTDERNPDALAELLLSRISSSIEPIVLQRPELRGSRGVLRAPRPSDRQDRARWGAHAEIVRAYGGDPSQVTSGALAADDVDRWYGEAAADALRWVIDVDGKCVGQVRLHGVDLESRRARLAIGLFAPELFDRGYGTEAVRLVLRYAFEDLGLHRVDLRVLAFNSRAIRAYEKCGFGILWTNGSEHQIHTTPAGSLRTLRRRDPRRLHELQRFSPHDGLFGFGLFSAHVSRFQAG